MMAELEQAARTDGFDLAGLTVGLDAGPARALYAGLGYRHAHGPFVTSTTLEAEDGGRVPVAGVLMFLVKDL